MVLFALVGTGLLLFSRAAAPNASVTAGQGTLSGQASVQSDNTASNGQRVTFGSAVPMDGNVALALSTPGTPFAPTSIWNTLLPSNTPVNPNNAAYLNVIQNNLCFNAPIPPATTFVATTPPTSCTKTTYYGALNTTAYSAPLYVVQANQPYVPVKDNCGHSGNTYYLNTVLGPGVPIPADAHPAVGSDSEMQIYQPSTDKYWDFWGLLKDASGNWGTCWGGVISNVSQSDGIFPNNTGATATSLPLIGADPRIEELQAGHIDHAIGLTIGNVASADLCTYNKTLHPNCPSPGFSWPATRTDGYSADPLAVPEGLRFRLPASLDLANYATTHPLTPVAMAIAVAVQKYGFVVNDSCPQPCMAMRLGDPTTYTTAGLPNPYTSGPGVGGVGNNGLFAGKAANLIMQNFPWDQLEALPFNYGEPGT